MTNKLNSLINFLIMSSNWQLNALIDIIIIDLLAINSKPVINNIYDRFLVVYSFISFTLNYRLFILFYLGEKGVLNTIHTFFAGASWVEREIWDLFGIFIVGQRDLRRILTDYGFTGHPLRKDFPLVGFFEVFYTEFTKRVVYRPVSLMQGFKHFKFKL